MLWWFGHGNDFNASSQKIPILAIAIFGNKVPNECEYFLF